MQDYVNFMSYWGDGNIICHTKMQDDANVVLLGVMEINFMCYQITSDEICCATKEEVIEILCLQCAR